MQASRHNVEIKFDKKIIIKDGVFAGERLQSVNIHGSKENRLRVLIDFQKADVPAEDYMIEGWLAELSVITAKRVDDDFTESLRLSAYTSRLKNYPADIVAAALLQNTWKFFPAWADLKPVLDELYRPRHAVMAKLLGGL